MADMFRCPDCGTKTKVPPRRYNRRKKGHVKTMWCWRCKKDRGFVRV